MKLQEDVQNLPAYAVYKNLIPGVKVYQDTNTPNAKNAAKRRKQNKAKKDSSSTPKSNGNNNNVTKSPLTTSTVILKEKVSTPTTTIASAVLETPSSSSAKKRRNRKRKSNKNDGDVSNLEPDTQPKPSKTAKSSTEKETITNILLPNPFATKKKQQNNNNNTANKAVAETVKASSSSKQKNDTTLLNKNEKKNKSINSSNTNNRNIDKQVKKIEENNSKTKNRVTLTTLNTTTPTSSNDSKKNGKANTTTDSSSNQVDKKKKKNKNKNKQSQNNKDNNSNQISSTTISNGHSKNKNTTLVGSLSSPEVQEEEEEETSDYDDEIPIQVLLSSRHSEDSFEHGKYLFQWLISPTPVTTFMSENWEKSPLLIKRNNQEPDYYKWLMTSSKLDEILRKNVIRYSKNIDITSYSDGKRETHNPVGRAMPAAVWDYYANGCSIRFLNPQTYTKPLWRVNAMLQEYFGTFVGANLYLTPPDSQGFAPHYDDIEAFILQVEGKKHWKVYKPRTDNEVLPRFSSPNFSEETDNLGEPVLDVVLEEGDLLYFPRGYIHQAKAVGQHSLHITLSCYQQNSWGDLLKEHLSAAVDQAMASDVEFRKGLPLDYLSFMGKANVGSKDKGIIKQRKGFINHTKNLIQKLMNNTTPDQGADNMGKKFMWDSLPPYLVLGDKNVSSFGDGEFMDEGQVYNRCELDPDVEVKLLRKNCVRLVFEQGSLRLYFTLENSLEYHGEEAQFVEIPDEAEEGIKKLISSYPDYVKIEDLPMPNLTDKVQVIADLWERGIVVTKTKLTTNFDDDLMDEDEIDIGDDDEDSEFDSEDGSENSDIDDFIVPDYGDEHGEETYDFDEAEDESDDDSIDYEEYAKMPYSVYEQGDMVEFSESDSDEDEEEDRHRLGKSYVEEITEEEEENKNTEAEKKKLKTPKKQKNSIQKTTKKQGKEKEGDDDDDDEVPQLVSATPINKTPKSKKNKKKKFTPETPV